MPCTSSKHAESGVYGEIEPCTGSAGELKLSSLSPRTAKRRMTRERSVPASADRLSDPTSTTMIVQTEINENTDQASQTIYRTMSSRENNKPGSTTLTKKVPDVCIISSDSKVSPANTANTSSLPSSSQQKSSSIIVATGSHQILGETSSSITANTSAPLQPVVDPTTAILHDEKEVRCSLKFDYCPASACVAGFFKSEDPTLSTRYCFKYSILLPQKQGRLHKHGWKSRRRIQ